MTSNKKLMSYKDSVELSDRVEKSTRLVSKYPDYVPVIVESSDINLLNSLKKKKYLVPRDSKVSHLMQTIRTKITLDKGKALFIFIDNKIVCPGDLIGDLYDSYKKNNKIRSDSDNFFYVYLQWENTFG